MNGNFDFDRPTGLPSGRFEADGVTPVKPGNPVMPSWWKPAKGMEEEAKHVIVAAPESAAVSGDAVPDEDRGEAGP